MQATQKETQIFSENFFVHFDLEEHKIPISQSIITDKSIKTIIEELNKNDERLKDIAYVTDWGSYYLVTFEHTQSKRFSLVFESEKYGKGTFSFAKVAKYIYTKKGF